MKVNVKLYGTLSRSVDGYDHQSGLDLSIPGETDPVKTFGDLLVLLNLQPGKIGIMLMDGAPVSTDTLLKNGAHIRIFQPIFGG